MTKNRSLPHYLISLADGAIVIVSVWLAYLLRFNFSIPPSEIAEIPLVLVFITAIRALLFIIIRSYIGIIRYSGLTDAFKFILILILGSFIFILADFISYYLINKRLFIPLTIIILEFLITTVLLLFFRSLINGGYASFFRRQPQATNSHRRPSSPDLLQHPSVTDQNRQFSSPNEPFQGERQHSASPYPSDETYAMKGLDMQDETAVSPHITALLMTLLKGKRILITGAGGAIGSELAREVIRYTPAALILADQSEKALVALEPLAGNTQQVPVSPTGNAKQVPVSPTGNATQVPVTLSGYGQEVTVTLELADVTAERRMEELFDLHHPQIVFHTAAYNNAALLETHPREAIHVNVNGTRIAATLSMKYGVERFILVSSNQAACPGTVLATSKRMAEICVQSLTGKVNAASDTLRHSFIPSDALKKDNTIMPSPDNISQTIFITVRHGLTPSGAKAVDQQLSGISGDTQVQPSGISGKTQVQPSGISGDGRTLTVPGFCYLVLEAAATGKTGEIFQVVMQESTRKLDQAKRMILQSGLQLSRDDDTNSGPSIPAGNISREQQSDTLSHNATIFHPVIVKVDSFTAPGETEQHIFDMLCNELETFTNQQASELMGRLKG